MEMDFARFRIMSLLLLAIAAGAFGYGYGWQRGKVAAQAESDRQCMIMQDQLLQRQHANAAAEAHAPVVSDTARVSAS